jgi:sugar phosphate isomerase/epimerase
MQLVIPAALNDPDSTKAMLVPGGRLYEQREACCRELAKIPGVSFVKNKAAFYIFPKLDSRFNITDDQQFAMDYLHSKNVMIIPGFLEPEEMPVYENDTQMWEEMAKNPKIAHMVAGVRRAVARAKGTDVAVTMEPYGDPLHAPFGRISQLLWFADQIEGLKMTLDTGNFIYTDEDALENAHRLAPMVTHLHCKSYAVDENEPVGRFYRGVAPAAIYEGYIPLWHILDYMEGCGYDGYLVIEEDNMEDHLTAAKNSIRYLKSFINRQK